MQKSASASHQNHQNHRTTTANIQCVMQNLNAKQNVKQFPKRQQKQLKVKHAKSTGHEQTPSHDHDHEFTKVTNHQKSPKSRISIKLANAEISSHTPAHYES